MTVMNTISPEMCGRRLQDHLRNMIAPTEIERVPGLDIGVRYEPASSDLQIGGDFYDVFPVGGQRYALIVGEAGGDGLEAVTLRLFLRFAISSQASLSSAVSQVNHLCIQHGVLEDFATLFAAIYNARTGTLTYVNAGHEPALRRIGRSDRVELLARSGPRLGVMDGERYEERATKLDEGDTLAIYTDGLIEHAPRCNPSLGIALLMSRVCCNDAANAAELANCIFTGTRGDAPRELFRDDACLLTVIRTGLTGVKGALR